MEYRISTNGVRFKIEALTPCGMLWWKSSKWKCLQDCLISPSGRHVMYNNIFYDSLHEAKVALHKLEKEVKKYSDKWEVVDPRTYNQP